VELHTLALWRKRIEKQEDLLKGSVVCAN
jgi:hypothetical protein